MNENRMKAARIAIAATVGALALVSAMPVHAVPPLWRREHETAAKMFMLPI
ncbi:MAG: hypothetical protein LBH14_07900 [Desulfobulbaceae bacterium]|jgi:hypothetical protein|nr:hypothetical protein [Desulfobulbaceae bacterium]